jgi:hypothetical protein
MKRASSAYLTLNRAIDALHHPDGRMVEMRTANGREFFILPTGGRVLPIVAAKIAKRPDVVTGVDPVFPLMAQTWRRLR